MKITSVNVILFAVAVCCSSFYGQTLSAQLDSLLTSPQYPVNGNVLVAENGEVAYKRSFGLSDGKNKLLNTADSKFQLASVTKVFTSTSILQLKDKGKLRLDDSLSKYLPEFPFPDVTIRHLLSHTSGLPDLQIFEEPVAKNPNKVFTNFDIIPALKQWNKPLLFKVGESWSYSNSGYSLLALLVERLSGLKYEDYVRQQIFVPANMGDSYLETESLKEPDKNTTKNQVYPNLYTNELQSVEMPKWRGFKGNGGIITTTGDMLKFDQALYSGKLLSQSTLDEAFTPMRLNSGNRAKTNTLNSFYGLGWFVLEDESQGKIVWHGGGRPGIVAVFLRNISKKQTVVVFDNSFNRETYRIGLFAINILNKKPFTFPKRTGREQAFGDGEHSFIILDELEADLRNEVQ